MTNNFISNETPIVGKLSIISMKGCEGITAKIDEYLRAFRGYEDTEEKIRRFNSEIALFQKRWKTFLKAGDPYYNPNLSMERGDFGLK